MANTLKIYNTLTRRLEPFKPINENEVRMYACGITVYDESHVGHASQAIIFDAIRSILKHLGYKVTYVRNFTDIDDKIIRKAAAAGKTADEIATYYIEDSSKDLAALKVRPADHEPRVTEHVPDIIEFIRQLVDKGYAYVNNHEVLFDVEKFTEYGKLSRQKLDQLVSTEDTPNKKNPWDFSLWKPAKEGEPSWESPWGPGRPGWHIECSVMAGKYLGKTLDIHGGGLDLVFPHHENEIAQSEACSGQPFANYWVHNGLVMVDGKKMAKSLGNFYTIKEILKKFHPDIIRFTVFSNHYSSNIDFAEAIFTISSKRVYYFYKTLNTVDQALKTYPPGDDGNLLPELIDGIREGFREAVLDNFNTARALANFSELFTQVNAFLSAPKPKMKQKAHTLRLFREEFTKVAEVLGIFDEAPEEFIKEFKRRFLAEHNISAAEIDEKIAARAEAKKEKDYETADKIRLQLKEQKIMLQDTPQGVEWDVILD
ncbi:MAG: cysteine--tRNA ligase [Candidatus Aminicenantes bacterium]|nr:cysteine--tRNA ligase [Candidatus Aminicenantes bacterium]